MYLSTFNERIEKPPTFSVLRELLRRRQGGIPRRDRPDEEDWRAQEHRQHDWMLDIV